MKSNILVILGHPDSKSLDGALAEAYAKGAESAGADVRVLKLGELAFDPIRRSGFGKTLELEPALVKAQELITWANHIVFVYPNWWGSMPALMKGFFDRAFTSGFAFNYRKESPMWDKLLKGRTAHLIVTMDTPSWFYRWIWHRPGHHQMKSTILGFCGIKVTGITEFAPVTGSSQEQREGWIEKVKQLGGKLA